MEKAVTNIEETAIRGVRAVNVRTGSLLQKEHFEWLSFPLETTLKRNQVVSGLLRGWHRTVCFDTVEYHEDTENFFFLEGTCIMIFCDRNGEEPDMNSIQLVKIPAGTQVEVEAGKCHYVPIPLTDTFRAYVFTPLQESILIPLKETVTVQ